MQVACVFVLIIFCIMLRHVDDGFRICWELKISISVILIFYSIALAIEIIEHIQNK